MMIGILRKTSLEPWNTSEQKEQFVSCALEFHWLEINDTIGILLDILLWPWYLLARHNDLMD